MKFLDFVTRLGRSEPREPGQERRRAPRFSIGETLDVYFWAETDVRYGDGELKDISDGGLRFVSEAELPIGSTLELKIHLPRAFRVKESLSLKAKVVRCYKLKGQMRYRIGCQFVDLPAETAAKLQEFLAWMKSSR